MLHVLYLHLFMLFCFALPVKAGNTDVKVNTYNQWHNLSLMELDNMAKNFLTKSMNLDSAMVCLSIMANRYYEKKLEGHDLFLSVTAMNHLGQYYGSYYHDYPASNSFLLQAEELAKQNGFDFILSFIKMNKANNLAARITNSDINANYDQLISEYKKVFLLALKTEAYGVFDVSFENIVNLAIWNNKQDSIQDVIEQFSEFKKNNPNKYGFAKNANKIYQGLLLLKNHQTEEALKSFDDIRIRADVGRFEYNLVYDTLLSYGIKANVLYELGRYDEALEEISLFEKVAKAHHEKESLTEVYRFYYRYYKQINNPDLADKNELEYLRLRDSINEERQLYGIEKTEFLFQLSKKNEEMRTMATKRKLQAYIMYGIIAFSVILLLVLLYIIYNYRETQKRNRQLYQRTLDLLTSDEENKRNLQMVEEEKQTLLATIDELKHKETATQPKPKYLNSPLDDASKDELLQKITTFMESSEDILKPTFSENVLSEAIEEPVYRISQTINERRECNFTTLLNEYRIKEACRRMSNVKDFGSLTIEGIGQSVGFQSRSHFVRIFKLFVGLTPSAYLKIAKEKA